MKKLMILVALVLALTLVLVACGPADYNNNPEITTYPDFDIDPNLPDFDFDIDDPWGGGEWVDPDGDPAPALVALINELYEGVDDVPMTMDIELTAANFEQFVFIDYVEGATGVVSQAMISAIPHAVVLIQLPEGADAAAVAAEIEEAADPNRWICVEAEKAAVFHSGNFVVFAMSFEGVVDGIAYNVGTVLA